ncbi:MAG: ATP-binding protein, partial [Bacteroidetes bacterium]|nr:ATP-binding protein [Bacteroidota bacterium]
RLKKARAMQKKALKERVKDYKQKAAEQVRLLAAQFDLQNKELTIKNEEKKILVQQNQLQKTELWLAITALLVIMSIFVMLFLQHRNRVKFHKEKIDSARRIIEMEESEKGRIARELHDLTGQLVLGISGMIENIEFSEPEIKQLINARIKELGTSIRRISHRMNRAMIEHFTFSELITGLCLDVQKLVGLKISFEIPEELPELPNELVLHFYRILQELLTNAGKYARQNPVSIVISYQHDELSLLYIDQGPGFIQKEKSKTGMGILNIYERVKLVNGKATFKSEPGIGTRWEFSFPLESKKAVKS